MLINSINKAPPTMEECLDALDMTIFDLSHVRTIKIKGMVRFCEEKLKAIDKVPERKLDSSFRNFCSLSYEYFRSEYKDAGTEWKDESLADSFKHLKEVLDEIKKKEPKINKLSTLCKLVSRSYIYYRNIAIKT